MNKNKILGGFFPLVALLILGGCSDDKFGSDSSSGKQISFRLQGNLPSSRATGTTVENINVFVVNAQVHDKNDYPLPDDADKLFSSQTVARLEGTANAFDYSPKRYYPDEAAFAYYSAYSPVTGNVDGFGGKTGSEINTITYFVPAPDIDGKTTQEDLLVAYTPVNGVALTPGAAPSSRDGFDTPVSLNFKHALSRVFVRASNSNVEPVVIKKLSLHNLYSEGTLKIDGDINEGYSAAYKVLWEPVDTQDKFYDYVLLPSGVSVPAKTEGSPVYVVGKEQGMLVLPQTTQNADGDAEPAATDFFIEVTYSISNVKEKTVRATFNDLNDKAGGVTFEMGRQYALTLAFEDTDIKFDIDVEGWDADEEVAYAATTVVFNANKPAEASDWDAVENIPLANSGFIYGQDLLDLTTAPAPVLDGWIFQGYYDSPELGAKQYYDSSLDPQIVFDTNGDKVPDATKWDKAGPSCTLYAHWAEATNVWGASNIYFRPDASSVDGSVGSLTFAKSDQSKSGYQGLFFKWGSLIGVAAYPAGGYNTTVDNGTYLYIPDVSTGKYYKVRAGAVSESYEDINSEKQDAIRAYAGKVSDDKSWNKIPYVSSGTTDDRSFNYLGSVTVHIPTDYQGDICKFLTDTKVTNGSGLKKNWEMPISDKWIGGGTHGYEYTPAGATYKKKDNSWSGANDFTFTVLSDAADGRSSTTTALMTYTITATNETVTFPASGYRLNGALGGVGYYGHYWSSSVFNGPNAYYLGFNGGSYVDPANYGDRAEGKFVRCVQN
jgi:hypothetical protein